MKKLFRWFKWMRAGKPMIHYEGSHCGVCGKWCDTPFDIETHKSCGKEWDTWGVCKECESIDLN